MLNACPQRAIVPSADARGFGLNGYLTPPPPLPILVELSINHPAPSMSSDQSSLTMLASEEECICHLEKIRWPSGVICPKCGSKRRFSRLSRGLLFRCGDCNTDFSVRKGTIFEDSHLPLSKWFAAIEIITAVGTLPSSSALAQRIGVSRKTASAMLEKLEAVVRFTARPHQMVFDQRPMRSRVHGPSAAGISSSASSSSHPA
jgi:transposase-like protein